MEDTTYNRLSHIISGVLHPFGIPVLGLLLLLFGPTVMTNLPIRVKLFLISVVLLNTCLLPACSILLLRWMNVIPNLSLMNRRQRIIPLGIVVICYAMGIGMLINLSFAFLISRFLLAALCCVFITFGINFFWKISLHLTAMGGLLGMIAVLCYVGVANLQFAFVGCLLLAGLLAGARLQLGCHTLGQIVGGTVLGGIISTAVILFF